MAVWSKIYLSEIELTRIDAEFYRPEYLEARQKAGSKKLKSYGVSISHPAEFIRKYEDSGLFILLAQNNRNNCYDWSTKRYASMSHTKALKRNRLEYGDVTITRSGANFGQTSVIGMELENHDVYACADLLILRSNEIKGHLVSTFFNTSVGRLLLDRGSYGAAQPHIAPNYVKEIPLPEFLLSHQIEIESLVNKSRMLSLQSESSYLEAQQLLESELELVKFSFGKPVGYTALFSDLAVSHRVDAQHFQPRFAQLLEHLEKFQTKRVRDIRHFNRRGTQPLYAKNGAYAVVNSQHLGLRHVNYDGLQKTTERAFKASPEAHVKINDILIYTTGAYIGRTNVFLEAFPALASNHVNILRLEPEIDHAYMAMVLQSVIGKFQTQKYSRGSTQAELYSSEIDKFIVPILPTCIQKEIGDMVRTSLEKQQEASGLLAQVKARVEQLIEEAVKK